MLSRKEFLAIVASMVASNLLPSNAFANDDELTVLSPENAQAIADNLLSCTKPDFTCIPSEPIKFYDTSGKAQGYIVDFYRADTPYGYVVIDSQTTGLISSYSFSKNRVGPATQLRASRNAHLNQSEMHVIMLNPLEFGLVGNDGVMRLNTNRTISLNNIPQPSSIPSSWGDVMVGMGEVYSNYTILKENYSGEVRGISEATVEASTGRYACAVTALMLASELHGISSIYSNPNDYLKLWELTETKPLPESAQTKPGIILGSTTNSKCGPGYSRFTKSKGITTSSYYVSNALYSTFQSHVDSKGCSLIHGRLENGGNIGHVMTVQGYATIRQNQTGNTNQMLVVADGWYMEPVCLNVKAQYYSYIDATLLYR